MGIADRALVASAGIGHSWSACQGNFRSSFVRTCVDLVADSFPARYFPTLAVGMDRSDLASRICDGEFPDVDGTESLLADELCRFTMG
jgi:hypothetical protein